MSQNQEISKKEQYNLNKLQKRTQETSKEKDQQVHDL